MVRIDFKRINELAPLAQSELQAGERNGPALTELIEIGYEWASLIMSVKGFFPPQGHEREDMIQWAVFGLVNSLTTWREDGGAPFGKWGRMAIICDLKEYMTTARRQKHLLLSKAASLNATVGEYNDEERLTIWNLPDGSGLGRDPMEILTQGQDAEFLMDALYEQLSDLEHAALQRCMLGGETYKTVAGALGVPPKSIDNALQRVNRKAIRIIQNLKHDKRLSFETRQRLGRMVTELTVSEGA